MRFFHFFSHRPGFSDFPYLYCVKCRILPFLHKKNHYFRKEFLDDTFLKLCSYFHAHPTTLLLEILGGRMHGPSHEPVDAIINIVPASRCNPLRSKSLTITTV